MNDDTIESQLRGGPPRRFLVTAAYHVPDGPLHLGHIGGPFLKADAFCRAQRSLGHDVTTVSSADAYESHVLLAATMQGRCPEELATAYQRLAHESLRGLNMAPEIYIDLHAEPARTAYARNSDALVKALDADQRIRIERRTLLRAKSTGRYLIAAFASGRCPACESECSGTSCEACGAWFDASSLVDVRSRLAADADAAPVLVPGAYALAGPEFSADEVGARFAPRCWPLIEHYLTATGPVISMSHPLGWGVPWRLHQLGDLVVHNSYGSGMPAAAMIMGDAYAAKYSEAVNAFSRNSDVTTVATGGFDAAMPWMFPLALTTPRVDWQPYRYHLLSDFPLLNGRKFSATPGHVIWAHEYLAAGLPVDELRGYLASVSGKDATRDLRASEFARWTRDVLAARWHRVVSEVLSRDPPPSTAREEVPDAIIAHRALAEFHALMSAPGCDLAAGLAVLDSWIRWHACGDRPTSPATFLRVTALLAWPFMPSWAGGLWRATGLTGSPQVRELGAPFRPRAGELIAFRAVQATAITALMPAESGVSGDVRTGV
jgi:methionyl-tRNA synthetase